VTVEEINIGKFLKKKVEDYCEENGCDKAEIASRIGITASSLSSIFRSQTGTIQSVIKVANACEQKGYVFIAEIETKVPHQMFSIVEKIFDLDIDQQILILQQLEAAVALAKGKKRDV
jgi:transcriptional regulator with XRE-family HTH domain